jgi:chemotaxis-related protein WspD
MKSSSGVFLPVAECWKKTGTSGDGTCPLLASQTHCRHCAHFTAGGRTLFDRAIPSGYREEWAELLAQGKEEGSAGAVSVVLFRLWGEQYALRTIRIQEIVENRFCHSIPFRRTPFLQGLVNISGELVPCLSLPALLRISGEAQSPLPATTKMIVAGQGSKRYVFRVDEVSGITAVAQNQFQGLPATLAQSPFNVVEVLFALEKDQIGLLDADRLFEAMERSLRE